MQAPGRRPRGSGADHTRAGVPTQSKRESKPPASAAGDWLRAAPAPPRAAPAPGTWSLRSAHAVRRWPMLALSLDCFVLAAAVLCAAASTHQAGRLASLAPYPLLVVGLLQLRRMYSVRLRSTLLEEIPRLVGTTAIAAMGLMTVELAAGSPQRLALVFPRLWLFSVVLIVLARSSLLRIDSHARMSGRIREPTLIVGAGAIGSSVARRLASRPEYGMAPVGFLDSDPSLHVDVGRRVAPVLGPPERITEAIALTGAKRVIVAFSSAPDSTLVSLVRCCADLGVDVMLVPRLFDSIREQVEVESLGGLPVIRLGAVNLRGPRFAVKHAIDRVVAAASLLALAPLFAAIGVAIKLGSPGPVFFRQRRIGRDGVEFDMLKFRSMRIAPEPASTFQPSADAGPGGVEGEDRRTRVGRWLRHTSIDELPQLINVLKGEMSLVGPRPERPEYAKAFEGIDRYADRLRVKSGMTGSAQIQGLRGRTSIVDRVSWDNHYIENWSFWLDLRIIVRTLRAAYQSGDDI